nr:uncharacterized protein LOC109420707 [Aedes albopictus]
MFYPTKMSLPIVIDNSDPRYIFVNGVRYRRYWTHPVTAESLPDYLLEKILKRLDWTDLQSAMLVNKSWMNTVLGVQRWFDGGEPLSAEWRLNVVPHADENDTDYQHFKLEEYHHTLMQTRRQYKHMTIYWGDWERCHKTNLVKDQMLVDIIRRFHQTLVSLRITSGRYEMPPWIMSDILRMCTNLKCLDLNEMQAVSRYDFCNLDTYRTRINTLYDSNQVFSPNPNGSNIFANVTTLQVKISPSNKLKDLLHKLSPQLVQLSLSWELDKKGQVALPNDEFPLLETLILSSERVGSDNQLGRFLQRMPQLKALTLSPHREAHISVLHWVNPESLRHLDVWTGSLCPKKFAFIAKFSHLESLSIRGSYAMPNGPKKDGIVFRNVTRLALFGHEWRLHLNSIMVFFPNLVELELEAKETWGPADARSISNNTSLKRLIVNEGLDTLEAFMEFCGELKVPELTVTTQSNAFVVQPLSKPLLQAPHIRKMSIYAYMIDPAIYKPMMQSMPKLRNLELTLQLPCDNKVYRRIIAKFPLCDTVRKTYQKYKPVLDNT